MKWENEGRSDRRWQWYYFIYIEIGNEPHQTEKKNIKQKGLEEERFQWTISTWKCPVGIGDPLPMAALNHALLKERAIP